MADFVDRYAYRVIWWEEDGEFVGLWHCAEFPLLSHLDDTPEKAFAGIREVVAFCRRTPCKRTANLSRSLCLPSVTAAPSQYGCHRIPIVPWRWTQLRRASA